MNSTELLNELSVRLGGGGLALDEHKVCVVPIDRGQVTLHVAEAARAVQLATVVGQVRPECRDGLMLAGLIANLDLIAQDGSSISLDTASDQVILSRNHRMGPLDAQGLLESMRQLMGKSSLWREQLGHEQMLVG
ncbi:MAG TPA: type III secretion system chaperone [Ramlibacter sp.]|nr:type III secretion system chaperone [Ramlibacter sp.]